jgi:hypothetical protein
MLIQHELGLSSQEVRNMPLNEYELWVAYFELRGIIGKKKKR